MSGGSLKVFYCHKTDCNKALDRTVECMAAFVGESKDWQVRPAIADVKSLELSLRNRQNEGFALGAERLVSGNCGFNAPQFRVTQTRISKG